VNPNHRNIKKADLRIGLFNWGMATRKSAQSY